MTTEIKQDYRHVYQWMADGKTMEIKVFDWGGKFSWSVIGTHDLCLYMLANKPADEIRLTIPSVIINGFQVPAPIKSTHEMEEGTFYIENLSSEKYHMDDCVCPGNYVSEWQVRIAALGIAHKTKEGAIASCKARLGIDPEWV